MIGKSLPTPRLHHPTRAEIDEAAGMILAMLADRATRATLCPSEVARALTVQDKSEWRVAMPVVHAAVDRLLQDGAVRLSWKGAGLEARAGPYRIAAGSGMKQRD